MQKSSSRRKLKNLRSAKSTGQKQKGWRRWLSGIFSNKPSASTTLLRRELLQRREPEQSTSSLLANKARDELPSTKHRVFIIWSLLIAAGLGLAINLYHLQIVSGPKLTQKARNQQMVNLRPFMPRRPVVDRNSNVLAIDRPVYTLYAHPKLFEKSSEQIAQQLASILDQDQIDLEKKFQGKRSGITLASGIPEENADRIASLHLNGLELIQKYSRFYPEQDLVAEVVGYVNIDRRGQAGVEYSQEKLLERSVQMVRLSRAGNGSLMPDHAPDGFLHFDDLQLQLTIDSRLQRVARSALKQQMEKFHAKRGTVIVMDAWDGSLLAMVTQPTYNPNEYSKADISLFKNWTVADLYEPGSTFKPLNVAIALETGAIEPNNVFKDPGFIRVTNRIIKNAENKRYGRLNIAQILQYSSNVGMVQIMQKIQPSVYYGWLQKLGLGQSVYTDLPFAVNSQLKSQEEFVSVPIEPATTSFGQGFSLTPLQLMQMQAALANGGKLVMPHIVRGLVDSKGQMHYSPNLSVPTQIFSPATSQKVVEMMETVVDDGTGKASQITGYRIAGKTGTAQKARGSGGGYITDAYITSFLGILPVESPRYVVLALVDEPKGKNAFGGTVAAPIAKSVMEALITIEQIPPSKPMSQASEH